MKILVVCDSIPAFDRSSYEMRFTQLLKILAKKCNVHICFADKLPEHKFDSIQNKKYIDLLNKYNVTIENQGIIAGIKKRSPNLILFSDYTVGGHLAIKRTRFWSLNARIIIDAPDVHYGRLLSKARLTNLPQDKKNADDIKVDELSIFRMADYVIVVSELEKSLISLELPKTKVFIVPNIHPIANFTPTESRDGNTLIFVGWGAYEPNVDAMEYFCQQVFPIILDKKPDTRLLIIGGDYPKSILDMNGGSIKVTGRVPDTKPYLQSSYISIAPLRFGSGVKGKIGEALSFGLPVVTTDIGIEGFGLTPNQNVLVGNNPEEFAKQVIKLLDDPSMYAKISREGWDFINSTYSFEAAETRISNLIQEIENDLPHKIFAFPYKIRNVFLDFFNDYLLWRFNKK